MKNKTPLIVFALFLPLAFGAWKWSRILEARFEKRLETPQRLPLKIVKGNASRVIFSPLLTDAFTLFVGGLNSYKKGYESENWQVNKLEFRASPSQNWKILPPSFWSNNWYFFAPRAWMKPINGEQQKVFSVFDYSTKREILVGQYRMRAQFNKEMHDDYSGFRYAGSGQFEFNFHVVPPPIWKNRIVLDSVQKVG